MMDSSSNNEKRCSNCKHWFTDERIAEKYGEGWGECSKHIDHFFCDHQAICFVDKSEINNNDKEKC